MTMMRKKGNKSSTKITKSGHVIFIQTGFLIRLRWVRDVYTEETTNLISSVA